MSKLIGRELCFYSFLSDVSWVRRYKLRFRHDCMCLSKVGNSFSAQSHLDIDHIIWGPYKIITLKTSLLCWVRIIAEAVVIVGTHFKGARGPDVPSPALLHRPTIEFLSCEYRICLLTLPLTAICPLSQRSPGHTPRLTSWTVTKLQPLSLVLCRGVSSRPASSSVVLSQPYLLCY